MSLNLLPSQAKFQVDKIRAQMLSRRLVSYFLVVWVVVAIVVMLIFWAEKWWYGQLEKRYNTVVADYLSSSTEIVSSQIIKFRTKLLAKVLADRFEYSSAFKVVGNVFDSTIKIKDFELKEKSFFALSVVASGNEAMKLVERRVAEINSGLDPQIKNVVIKSVVYSKASLDWLVTMEVYLK